MTTQEFSLEFDILYNSIASNAAQPVDEYEKSVFLTQAQEELIKNYYNFKGNKYQEGFEITEKRRRDLEQLVSNSVSYEYIDLQEESLSILNIKSRFFKIEKNVMFIVAEKAKMISEISCYNNINVNVKPVSHNEFTSNIDNPFKRPKDFFWRMDRSNVSGIFSNNLEQTKERVIELIYDEKIGEPVEYRYRYIKYPKPIILTNLTSLNLSINGQTNEQTSELSDHINREILNRAVELALESSGNPRTESKIQLNQRNE